MAISLTPGQKVRFDGMIQYGQDHAYWKSDFGDKEFTFVQSLESTGRLVFEAPGYGVKNNYGNGRIYVSPKYSDNMILLKDKENIMSRKGFEPDPPVGRPACDIPPPTPCPQKKIVLEVQIDEESYHKVLDSINQLQRQAKILEAGIDALKKSINFAKLSVLRGKQTEGRETMDTKPAKTMVSKHDHLCHCGTGEPNPHETGTGGCVRYMTVAPVKIGEKWLVDGHEITDFTLRQQRGYHQHPCGCWSCHPGSSNSLPDET